MENSTASQDTLRRGPALVAGCVIAVIALALRWPQLHDSLWLDELHTSWCVSGSWSDVYPRTAIGNQSPLYFYMLRLLVSLFGLSELSLRLPSLIAGMALVGVVGFATARWTRSVAAAIFAATLVAIDRNFIFYSQEARPYAILQLVAWCHALIIWQLADQPSFKYRLLFVFGGILQFYLHYTSALFLFAEIIFLVDAILARKNTPGYRWSQLAVDVGLIAVATLPMMGHLQEISSRRKLWEQFVNQMPTIRDFCQTIRLDIYWFPSLVVLVVWYLLRLDSSRDSTAESGHFKQSLRRSTALIVSLVMVPAVLAWVATRRQLAAVFMNRYLVSSLIGVPIGAAILNRLIPSIRWRTVAIVLTVATALWRSGMWQQWQLDRRLIGDRRQDWRGAVEFVNRHSPASNSICFVRSGFVESQALRSPHDRLLDAYCLAPVNNIYKLQMNTVPVAALSDIQIKAGWLAPDDEAEIWFLLNSRPESRDQFIADVEKQGREQGLPTAFEKLEFFGDVLACQLARKK